MAPCATAKTDEELGINEFSTKYFANADGLYLDQERVFVSALGNRTLKLFTSWKPWRIIKDFRAAADKVEQMKGRGIEGNMRGEGLIAGGVLVVDPSEGVVFCNFEETSTPVAEQDLLQALQKIGSV